MGQRDGFSAADIKRIRIMYECNGSGGSNMGGGSSSLPGKPIGTNKPIRPKPGSASGGGTKPIKPVKPVRPIKPIRPFRPAALSSNNNAGFGGDSGGNPFGSFISGAANQFMQGLGNIGNNLMGSIGFDEEGKGRSAPLAEKESV